VTLWYFLSPYGVRPNPAFHQDMERWVVKQRGEDLGEGRWVENWTKWKLELGDQGEVGPMQRLNIENMSLPLAARMEWRGEYVDLLEEVEKGEGEGVVTPSRPWPEVGLYHHYNVRVEGGNHVVFLPNFMFSVPQWLLDELYGGADGIPTIGMMADSTGGDRVIVQCFMNLVILTVILLLWANNPPSTKKEE